MGFFKRIGIFMCAVAFAFVLASCSMSPNAQSKDTLFQQISIMDNWRIFKTTYSRSLNDITTLTANGIVGDNLDIVLVNDNILAAGSLKSGVSFISLQDLDNPKGKVQSYIGPNTGVASDRLGFSGLAIHPDTDKMYAWYGPEIVDLEELEPIYTDAPDYTHSRYTASPSNRFIIDSEGCFWIGTSNLEADSSTRQQDENGLFKITITGGNNTKEEVLEYPVWHLYKDSDNALWASTYNGLYKINAATKASEIILFEDSSRASWFIEQVFEYNNDVYAIAKNFFHNANGAVTKFELYSYNETARNLKFVATITQESDTDFHQARAFVYNNAIYIALGGSLRYLDTSDRTIKETRLHGLRSSGFGQYSHCVVDDTLYSVGNFSGISMLSSSGHTILTQAATAEELISDNIFTLHVSSDQNTVYVGPYGGGGISILNTGNLNNLPFAGEASISSFFEYEGDTYVQGSGQLGKITDSGISVETQFYSNGERSTFDPSGYIWAYPTFGNGTNGVIAMLDLDDFTIRRIKDPQGRDYYERRGNQSTEPSLFWDVQFDQRYHYNHVLPIPGSSDMMIALSEGTGDFRTNPHTLRYSHETNTFTKVPIADSSSEGIMYMASDGTNLYGVARQKLFVFEGSRWVEKCPILLGNDFKNMIIVGRYAIIASGWNSNGPGNRAGFEIVNLTSKQSKYYTSGNTPLPSDTVISLAAQKVGVSRYKLWVGTNNGLAYCTVAMP